MCDVIIVKVTSAHSHAATYTKLNNIIICSYFHRNIALAWVVTVPASGLLSAAAVAILREIVL
jgi:phosphate/sulfate permease